MKVTTHLRAAWAVTALSLALAGCATSGSVPPESDLFGSLSSGESSVAYSTAFPVGSPEEAYRNGEAALRAGDTDRALFEYLRGLRMEKRPRPSPCTGSASSIMAGATMSWPALPIAGCWISTRAIPGQVPHWASS
ncbi:hypothetical protein [Billgrantia tianxiuensis]|uniref:hypothetical protein n=1 Tax=Billgrantia tianxiuensis TaxID=2497861 RepID=UPI001915DACF|nr:hypothetical protein [Halomonas tianxiuensis]